MVYPDKEFLISFGWDDFFESSSDSFLSSGLLPARVITEQRNLYRVQVSRSTSVWASIRGKMQFNASSRQDYPAVGDWVWIEVPNQAERAIIHSVCRRKSVIQRKQSGTGSDIQILAANVDFIFVTTSLNEDLNFRRLERYLSIVWEAGAIPIVLLTKSDLCKKDLDLVIVEVEQEFPGIEVHVLSKEAYEKAQFFEKYLRPGKTCVVVGSSGVGKSTLVNYLIGKDQMKTQSIREDDGKGRHTTTARSLFVTFYGGLIIDTPGMRELQLSDHKEGVQTQFEDIEGLMVHCRFGNCQHQTESGCSIKRALEEGSLSEERWSSYQKLMAEVRHEIRKRDKAMASEDRKLWKKLSRDAKVRAKMKRS